MTDSFVLFLDKIPGFYNYLFAFTLMFARTLAFFQIAPVFRRKELFHMAKIGLAMAMSFFFMGIIDIGEVPKDVPYLYLFFINILIGYFFGLICRFIYATIQAAGDMANNQMALSSASTFDPSTRVQTSIVGQVLSWLGLIIFIEIGGIEWLFLAFRRIFDIFPVFEPVPMIVDSVTLDYIIYTSGNIIFTGFQMVGPVIITTLAIDITLGIISKTAPQINVFQLSFVFKPCVGVMVLLATLPIMLRVIEEYFIEHAQFF